MIAILINCITLGSYQPCYDTRCESSRCQWLKLFDHVIFVFFFMEMLIKMVAMGVSSTPAAYLADYWNRLDCFIVLAGGLEYVLDVGQVNFTAIRTVRVLRPLRAINRIPSMRILVTLLLDTLPMLGNVLLLCFFVFFIFGIIGVQLWSGLLRQRCFISLPGNMSKPSYVPAYYRAPLSDKEYLCSTAKDNGLHRCQDLPPLRSADLTTLCQNTLPHDWRPPDNDYATTNTQERGGRARERFIDGEPVPWDLVPGDEASPFLVKQMSPLIAQSVFQPAFAPHHLDSLPSMRQRRRRRRHLEAAATQMSDLDETTTTTTTPSSSSSSSTSTGLGARVRAARRAERKFLLESRRAFSSGSPPPAPAPKTNGWWPELVETNLNSDQFDSISQQELARNEKLDSRRTFMRKKQNKGSCINWNKYYTNCHAGETNPFQGTISFDNVGMAWTTIFLVISLEGWSDIMYLLQDSHSFWVWTYFVLLIVIGSFFMINLCLVVIATQFSATKKREMERMRQERLKFSSSSTLTATSESTNCYTVIVKYIAHTLRRFRGNLVDRLKRRKCSRIHRRRLREQQAKQQAEADSQVSASAQRHPRAQSPAAGEHQTQQAPAAQRRSSWKRSSKRLAANQQPASSSPPVQSGAEVLLNLESCADHQRAAASSRAALLLSQSKATKKPEAASESGGTGVASLSRRAVQQPSQQLQQQQQRGNNRQTAGKQHHQLSRSRSTRFQHPNECPYCDGADVELSLCPAFIGKNARFERYRTHLDRSIKRLVDHRYFQRLILLAILINAISMGIEYHNQPQELTEAVEISNILFACLFLVEMLLKLYAHGLYDYVIDGFNCFDGCIVIISILELFASTSGGSGLSVLRTFRLLRILKLVRFMPALRRQLVIMLRTLDNVAVFFGLLVLFIFIFAILGMNLFGCKFCETLPDGTERCDRKNFNSLLWSLVTVFQILTQEDWNVVLFNGMEKTSHWAALYFVLLMTFGNYVLFNLLVAILVEGFSQEDDLKVSSSSSYTMSQTGQGAGKQPLMPAPPGNCGPTQRRLESPDMQAPAAGAQFALAIPSELPTPTPTTTTTNQHHKYANDNQADNSARLRSGAEVGASGPRRCNASTLPSSLASEPAIGGSHRDVGLAPAGAKKLLSHKSARRADTPVSGAQNDSSGRLMMAAASAAAATADDDNEPLALAADRAGENTTAWRQLADNNHSPAAHDERPTPTPSPHNNFSISNSFAQLAADSRASARGPDQLVASRDESLGFNNVIGPTETRNGQANTQNVTQAQRAAQSFNGHGNLTNASSRSFSSLDELASNSAPSGPPEAQEAQQLGTDRDDDGGGGKLAEVPVDKRHARRANPVKTLQSYERRDNQLRATATRNRRQQQLQKSIEDANSSAGSSESSGAIGTGLGADTSAASSGSASGHWPAATARQLVGEGDNCKFMNSNAREEPLVANKSMNQESSAVRSNDRPTTRWNYDQLVTSVLDPSFGTTKLSADAAAKQHATALSTDSCEQQQQQQQQQQASYFGLRRPPKRLVYFYDMSDDIDEEVAFLAESLETKSYAISMMGQHDHYLENIAKSQAAAARAKANSLAQRQQAYQVNAYKAEQHQQIRQLEMGEISGREHEQSRRTSRQASNPYTSPQVARATSSSHQRHLQTQTGSSTNSANKRPSLQIPFTLGASSAGGSQALSISTTGQTGGTRRAQTQTFTIELPLSPHWSSVPCELNRTALAMTRYYQSSLASNFVRGRRERALLSERGHFDKSACRVDFGAYARAVDVFMSKDSDGAAAAEAAAAHRLANLDLASDASQRPRHSSGSSLGQKQAPTVASPSTGPPTGDDIFGSDINLGFIYEPFKLFPANSKPSAAGHSHGTRNRLLSMSSQINQQFKQRLGSSSTTTCPGDTDRPEVAPKCRGNALQRAFLKSLREYALAMSRLEERREQMRRRQREQEALMNQHSSQSNLNRTTQAIRRGSVVVLNKLKLLHAGPPGSSSNSHVDNVATNEEQSLQSLSARASTGGRQQQRASLGGSYAQLHRRTANVPRLSLTKAESLAQSSEQADSSQGNQSHVSMWTGQLSAHCAATSCAQLERASSRSEAEVSEIAIPVVGSSIESLELHSSAATLKQQQPIQSSSLLPSAMQSGGLLGGPQAIHSRHSIANLPTRSSLTSAYQLIDGQLSASNPAESVACRPGSAYASHEPQHQQHLLHLHSHPHRLQQHHHKPRPSIIGSWFVSKRAFAAQSGVTTSNSNRNSCFSANSKSGSSIGDSSGESCTRLLKPNLRRRRSFSGPLEWLERSDGRRAPNSLLLETSSRKDKSRKRAKKMKPQKSNSSDYHSLNNRRVYRLDSRGFQTKLQGTFYVITRDPLAGLSQLQATTMGAHINQELTIASYGYDWAQQAPASVCNAQQPVKKQQSLMEKETLSSNELESSFFNTSLDELSRETTTNGADRSVSRDTLAGRSSGARSRAEQQQQQQQKRTFLIYFHWTQWMIQRRHYSLFLFSPTSRVRRFCAAVTNRREFDYFVLFFISMNCVTLAMERPRIPPWSKEREFLTLANYYFTFMFTLEMLLKVIAKGLYYGKDAYLSDSWNIMDGTLVGFSLFDVLLSIVADRSPRIFAILRVFRLLRSLRPLRVINRLMGLKLVVQTLLLSLRPIGNIVLICCTFFIIFGILGVQLFKGTFYYCDGPDPLEIMRTVRTRDDCLLDHRNRWINRKYNFDNLGQALMALFVLSSKDGWVNIMYTGLDAVGVDMQPRENYNEWRLLYFISFLLLVAFFVLNMFVGVVVENFHRCRKEQELEEKARRAEKRQRKLDKRRRQLREPPYYANYGRFRLLLHKWVTGGYFDLLIAAVIGFNVVFMSLEHYQMPPELIYLLKVSNYVFTAAFIVEALIKSSALGMRRYLKDRWNQLDVAIVVMSIIGILFEEMDSFTLPINPTLLRVLRVMRIARVLKLLKMAKGIRALLDTVMQALPQVGNLGLLFFLLFFIFAALGVELFGRLECNEEYPCSGLMDQHAHFQNFGLAFLTLFRVATGDNWNGIMKDTLRDKCDPSSNCLKNCCVSQIIAPLYFVVFVLLAQFVLVNVVVAVLMKHLEESHHEMEIDEEYELDKQLAEELEAKKRALLEAKERQNLYWI